MAIQNVYNYSKPKITKGAVTTEKKAIKAVNKKPSEYGNKYLEQKIFAAKPEELTLMLYEGIIKFINQAKIFMGQKNIEKTNNAIQRAQSIVVELSGTLDMEYEYSSDLVQLYDFIAENLVDANIKKVMKPLDDALEIAQEMRQMWKEVMEVAQ